MSEGWIDVGGVRENAVAHAARSAIEEVVGDDFAVVVRSVGEGAAPIAIADGEDAGSRGAELIIDGDVAALVGSNAGGGKVQVIGVGYAADSQQDM